MIENLATLCFGLALVHTFIAPRIAGLRHRFRENSPGENLMHLLSEVEIIFGLWAAIFFLGWSLIIPTGLIGSGGLFPLDYLESVNFTESIFVFVIMTLSGTRPLLNAATKLMKLISDRLVFSEGRNLALTVLTLGPLLGSLITEPAAMTVCCFLLWPLISAAGLKESSKYFLLGLLFVNISIGGTLTNFAAPPVLVVARHWGWSSSYMFEHFGWRAAAAVLVSTVMITTVIRKQLDAVVLPAVQTKSSPIWVILIDAIFIGLAVVASHHIVVLFAIFLFFLGYSMVTSEYRDELKLRESLLVGFFLAGLVTLGGMQEWWIRPMLSQLGDLELFWSATALTAITDNALLTYLGTLVPEFSEAQKLSLVGGAVCGGGLTVIANAPNPIGYSLLKGAFGEDGISASKLFLGALIPTIVAALLFLV